MRETTFAAAAVLFALSCAAQIIGPSIEIRARSAETVTGSQAADIAASTTHVANSAIHLTTAQVSKIAAAITGETDSVALNALAQFAATSRVDRVLVSSNSWYTFAPGTATLWTVSADLAWFGSIGSGYTNRVSIPELPHGPLDETFSYPFVLYESPGTIFFIGGVWELDYRSDSAYFPTDFGPFNIYNAAIDDWYHITLDAISVTNTTAFLLPTPEQVAQWNAKIDSTNGVAQNLSVNNLGVTGSFTQNGTNICDLCRNWSPIIFGPQDNTLLDGLYGRLTMLSTSYSNRFCVATCPCPYSDSIVRVSLYVAGSVTLPDVRLTVGTVYQHASAANVYAVGAYTALVDHVSAAATVVYTCYVPTATDPTNPPPVYSIHMWSSSYPSGSIYLESSVTRPATSVERALWIAGIWSPTNSL